MLRQAPAPVTKPLDAAAVVDVDVDVAVFLWEFITTVGRRSPWRRWRWLSDDGAAVVVFGGDFSVDYSVHGISFWIRMQGIARRYSLGMKSLLPCC